MKAVRKKERKKEKSKATRQKYLVEQSTPTNHAKTFLKQIRVFVD